MATVVNLILGLGGTGAKIVESFVHLCASGLGPPRAAVAFIDQDRSNGNTLRARTTLARYAAAHEVLRAAGGEHPEPACNLLRTRLDPHPDASDSDGCHWVPQSESDVNLAGLISYSLMRHESSRGLARALFRDEDELRMHLNEGYRGRPHVGSAALLMRLEGDEFWRSLDEVVRNAKEEVRVFLCGSAFGGTGAAVLPTLARRLRQVAAAVQRPLRTGGVLMLPYFTFAPPENREANVAAGHELLLQSQSALQYYHDEMEFGGCPYSFDDLYFVGWDPAIELSYHSAGAATQANPPLAPELFGALAAARFFQEERRPIRGSGGDERPVLHVIARSTGNRLGWQDLPSARDGQATSTAYAAWLRFCALWHFNYVRAFGRDRPAGAADEAWYRTVVGDSKPEQSIRKFSEYVSTALRYAAAMSAFSTWDGGDADTGFDLWTYGPLAAVDRKNPPAEPELDGGTLAGGLGDFGSLVRGYGDAPDAADIYWTISQKPSPSTRGLWPLVALLHDCANP